MNEYNVLLTKEQILLCRDILYRGKSTLLSSDDRNEKVDDLIFIFSNIVTLQKNVSKFAQ